MMLKNLLYECEENKQTERTNTTETFFLQILLFSPHYVSVILRDVFYRKHRNGSQFWK